jgi:hypothetical protein
LKSARAQEVLGAAIVMLIAALFLYVGRNLRFGQAAAMGPGYLPRILAVALLLLGLVVAVRAFFTSPKPVEWPSWRATLVVVGCPIVLAVLMPYTGLAIAIVVVALVARLAQKQRWGIDAIVTPVALSVFCSTIFVYLLKLPMKLWP